MRHHIGLAILLAASLPESFAACSRDRASAPGVSSPAPAAASAPQPVVVVTGSAHLGQAAPDFTLSDTEGHVTHLSDYRGKVVVLEWFNPDCPFVNKAHTKGSLNGTAARHTSEGVVWLAVDSAAPGKQGYDVSRIRDAVGRFHLGHPVLRDETGAVGHAYGATNTPHMFVIDISGTLVYGGAIDNSPDAEGESPQGGPLVNYVDAALEDLAAGRPVRVPESKAYGCHVKYGS